jgi:very-short-patch-repair endonuclease
MSLKNARDLRNDMTHAERLLWKYLSRNQLGVRFRRQVPIGRYIVDFVCFYPPLIIECDGEQHAFNQAYDEERDTFLRRLKFQVLRFWNYEILNYPGAVIDYVLAEIKKAKCKNFDHLPPPC